MNILSHFYQLVEKSFNNYLKNYFSSNNYFSKSSNFDNYRSFITNLDNFSLDFTTNIIKSYFEYIDDVFFNSSYRKNFCTSKGFYERKNYVTLFGEISFKRRYYFDKSTNEHFFFVDFFLGLPKRKHFDPFVCSEIVDSSASTSYSNAGKIVANKIGSRINDSIFISRATARNIVLAFNPVVDQDIQVKKVKRLFVMLDEKFIGSQFNDGKKHMVKSSVIFEDTALEYKHKKKPSSPDRYRLINPHACASIDNLLTDTVDYIHQHYDTDYLDDIFFMGDCASWIKNFPKSDWFKFHSDLKVHFSMDGFHFSQALYNITTYKNQHWYNALLFAVKKNNLSLFNSLCEKFVSDNKDREVIIRSKMQYIINNWDERQTYQNKSFLKCSMESHISHILADLFTSRPKAYSKSGLEKLLSIRLLKVNGYNLKEIYLNSLYSLPSSQPVFPPSVKKSFVNLNLNDYSNDFIPEHHVNLTAKKYFYSKIK